MRDEDVAVVYSPQWTAVAGHLGQFAHGFGVSLLNSSAVEIAHTQAELPILVCACGGGVCGGGVGGGE